MYSYFVIEELVHPDNFKFPYIFKWILLIFEGGFWARGLEYELIDDFCYTLIVICYLGHTQRRILVAKIPISHGGNRTSELPILSPTL